MHVGPCWMASQHSSFAVFISATRLEKLFCSVLDRLHEFNGFDRTKSFSSRFIAIVMISFWLPKPSLNFQLVIVGIGIARSVN